MKLPRDMGAAELIKALQRLGYRRLQCDDPIHSITIPNHRPLRIGTLSAILADIAARREMDRETLMNLLFD